MTTNDGRGTKLEQRSQAITTLMAMVLLIFLIQLWLITIALESYLAANRALAIPTFLASAGCFLINLWILKWLYEIDRNEG